MFELVCRYTNRLVRLQDKLTATTSAAAKKAESDAAIIKSLREHVNPLHKEIDKIGKAYERACYLREEREKDMETMKEKLLQVEQQWAKSEHDLAMKAIEAEKLRV